MASPQRKAIPSTLSLAPDAKALLKILVPNSRAYGLFISELIRREVDVRLVRQGLLKQLHTEAFEGVPQCATSDL